MRYQSITSLDTITFFVKLFCWLSQPYLIHHYYFYPKHIKYHVSQKSQVITWSRQYLPMCPKKQVRYWSYSFLVTNWKIFAEKLLPVHLWIKEHKKEKNPEKKCNCKAFCVKCRRNQNKLTIYNKVSNVSFMEEAPYHGKKFYIIEINTINIFILVFLVLHNKTWIINK